MSHTVFLPGERFMSMFDGDRRPSPAQSLVEEQEPDSDILGSDSEHSSTPLESDGDTHSTDRDSDFVEVIFDGRKVTPSSGGGKGLPSSNAKQRRHSFLLSAHKSPLAAAAAANTPVSSSSLQSERKRFMSSKASVIINSHGGHANDDNKNKHITPTTNRVGSTGFSSPQPPSSSEHMTKEEFLKMQREVHLYGKW